MKYLSGIYALNITCSLDTAGDWHQSSLNWKNIYLYDSENMFFKNYGIESKKSIPEHKEKYYVANHIRALMDLLQLGKYSIAEGMNNEYICNEKYDMEIFDLVYKMKVLDNWDDIDNFMGREYLMKWLLYKKEKQL